VNKTKLVIGHHRTEMNIGEVYKSYLFHRQQIAYGRGSNTKKHGVRQVLRVLSVFYSNSGTQVICALTSYADLPIFDCTSSTK
jgi:hypothetical protein